MIQMALFNAFVLHQFKGQRGTFLEFQEVVMKARISGGQKEGVPVPLEVSPHTLYRGNIFPVRSPTLERRGSKKRCSVFKKGEQERTLFTIVKSAP